MAIGADLGRLSIEEVCKQFTPCCGNCRWWERTGAEREELYGICKWPVPLAFSAILDDRRNVYESEKGCPCFRINK